jgi:lantibiotic transport system ATP-binding protein
MNSYCLKTDRLSHQFRRGQPIIKNLCLNVPKGSIYGFLGPNGAGKTTTLRLMLGLLKKQQGEITFFNQLFNAENRISILQKTGSLIESPSLYAHLSAAENLLLLQKIYRCPKSRIGEVLKLVGLDQTGNKKTEDFSLGMKQRLGIAIAMLHKPELLILDEPTNGLDPNGMIDIRELLLKLNRDFETTIIISSHLLSEIEKLVTHIGIISQGEMRFEGTLEALKSKQSESSALLLDTNNPVKTQTILWQLNLKNEMVNGKIKVAVSEKSRIATLNRELVLGGIDIYEMTPSTNNLENIFMTLINP